MSQLILNLDKLRHNIRFLSRHCREHRLGITGIIKRPVCRPNHNQPDDGAGV